MEMEQTYYLLTTGVLRRAIAIPRGTRVSNLVVSSTAIRTTQTMFV